METDDHRDLPGHFSWLLISWFAWLTSPTSNDAHQPIRPEMKSVLVKNFHFQFALNNEGAWPVPSRGRVLMLPLRWLGTNCPPNGAPGEAFVSGELSNLVDGCLERFWSRQRGRGAG